jgi:DNA-binding PadR family transcriptional regulator
VIETRLLLLGAVALFEPVNGYQIRRELISWQVEEWAHINPGSIYTGLTTLTRRGHLVRHDLTDGSREVAVYELTSSGRQELSALFEQALETVDVQAPLAFSVALGMLPLLERGEALRHLRRRLEALTDVVDSQAQQTSAPSTVPPHTVRMIELWRQLALTERDWLRELVRDVESGDLYFSGEPSTWRPADDDPGWQLARDRARYQAMLAQP